MAASGDNSGSGFDSGSAFDARAAIVNRTHRVIRERATAMQAHKRTVRDMVVPCVICSALLMLIAIAVWTIADEGFAGFEDVLWKRVLELSSDTGSSISILLVWFLPLSVVTAAVVLLHKSRTQRHGERVPR